MKKEKKEDEISEYDKILNEFNESLKDFSKEFMKTMIAPIKKATEEIKKIKTKIIEDIELIQDEEDDKIHK